MAELVTIARPYADAVFRIATKNNALASWSERLSLLSAITADKRILECVNNPQLSAAQKSDLFNSLADNAPGSDEANLIQVLAKNERLSILPEIASLFDAFKNAAEGVKNATIYSAFQLDDAQTQALVKDLEDRFGGKIKANIVVDQSLIGGVKIVVGDQVLDTSVRGKLDAMALALKN